MDNASRILLDELWSLGLRWAIMKARKPATTVRRFRIPLHLLRALNEEAVEVRRSVHNLVLLVLEQHVEQRTFYRSKTKEAVR